MSTSDIAFLESPLPVFLKRDHVSGPPLHRIPARSRIRPGVYVEKEHWDALAPWERYLVRVHAAAEKQCTRVFCLESAAALLGLPVFGEPRDIHVIERCGYWRRRGDIVVHTTEAAVPTVFSETLMCTSVAETAAALARVLPPAFGLACADAAFRKMHAGGMLCRLPDSDTNRRGIRQLEWVRLRATADTESAGESVSRAVIEWLGYQVPQLQHPLHHEGYTYRADFWWPDRSANATQLSTVTRNPRSVTR